MDQRHLVPLAALLAALVGPSCAAGPDATKVQVAIGEAVAYVRGHLEAHGGYLWWYKSDLTEQAGEGTAIVPKSTVWVQPPGTPTVGLAYLRLYEVTGDKLFLDAATATGECLAAGQLQSGGWQAHIDFGDPVGRALWYRRDADRGVKQGKRVNNSSLDDDITQSALRLLVRLDHRLGGANVTVHAALALGLEALLKAQYANGGWPQVFDGPVPDQPVLRAHYPATWSREPVPNNDYWVYYTLNDDLVEHMVDTLLLCYHEGGDRRCLAAAAKSGDFLLLAQMPEPQPIWAQQYNFEMVPFWARRFEPPAVTSLESAGALDTLVELWLATGDEKYLGPLPAALRWFQANRSPDGTWPRFHELQANRPLYMTANTYKLTYDGSNPPPHYGWRHDVSAKLASVEDRVARGREAVLAELSHERTAAEWRTRADELAPQAAAVIDALDDQGRWVTKQTMMRGQPLKVPREVIQMDVYTANLELLADCLEALQHLGG